MVRENKKSKFNIIDLIIVLLMALAIVGIFLRYNIADDINFNATGEVFEIEFYAPAMLSGTEDYLYAGEKFHINIESMLIGEIKEIIDVREAVINVTNAEGDIVKSTSPNRVDVTGIMISKGRTTKDGNIMLNGNIFVSEGKDFLAHTSMRECTIYIMDIKKID